MARSLILILVLFITGCANNAIQSPEGQVNVRPASEFTANGKLGIRSESLNESARFVWIQQGPDYEIELLDPFGRQIMNLIGEPGQVVLRTNREQETRVANSPEQLMQNLLGWQVPVEPAKYWIQGHPVPGANFEQITDRQFQQFGWTVDLLQLQAAEQSMILPRKVRLTNAGLELTLIISQWRFTSPN